MVVLGRGLEAMTDITYTWWRSRDGAKWNRIVGERGTGLTFRSAYPITFYQRVARIGTRVEYSNVLSR